MTASIRIVAAAALLLAALATPPVVQAQSPMPVPPAGPGPFPVACSNIEQDLGRVPSGASPTEFWEGENGHYLTDLLIDPANALVVDAGIPDRRELFDRTAGSSVPYALLVCYPTDSSNPRADYPLPGAGTVPRMQRGSEPPILPETFAPTRWPLMIYAHGFGGNPLSGGYLPALLQFASHGFIVAAPFFGDARFSTLDLEGLSDVLRLVTHFPEVVEMQAVRPIGVSSALDYLLGHPQWRDVIDASRIGGFGASQGGETLLLVAGAGLTTTLSRHWQQVMPPDRRLRGIVGYVPYFGHRLLPAFGDDQRGLDGFDTPFMAIAGTADQVAPMEMIEQGVNRMSGSRFLVQFAGGVHGLDPAHVPDLFTWSLAFLDAFVNANPRSRALVATMTSVVGGADDSTRIDYTEPLPPSRGEVDVSEYWNAGVDHFFITGHPYERWLLDSGYVPEWRPTGFLFKALEPLAGAGNPVCRFYGRPGTGRDSHFYTAFAHECAIVNSDPLWLYEGVTFNVEIPAGDRCAADHVPVYRLYNNFRNGQPNHRYTTSRSTVAGMRGGGWILEGTVFCARP